MERRSFYYLFAGLMVLLVIEPFLEGAPRSDRLILLAFTSMIVIGSFSLADDGRAFHVGLGLASVGMAAAIGFYGTDAIALEVLDLSVIAAFCVLAIGVKGRHVVLGSGLITLNRIFGALCIYLLLGVLWAVLFGLVDVLAPGAFRVLDAQHKEPLENLLYYSFVTLTTLGYGDVTPLHPVARTLAYLEAVVGQLFIAVLIASLVGRRTADLEAGRLGTGR